MRTDPRREEIANAITHGLGAVGSLAGGSVLITLAALFGDGWRLSAAIVFSTTLVLLYSASTLFHAIPHRAIRARLQVLDHCAIYLLIAGTYTPFTLISLPEEWRWTIFAIVWSMAILGVLFKLFFTGRFRRLSTASYLSMAWFVLVAARPLSRALPTEVIFWLLLGGVAYTGGTYFYHSQRIPYAHTLWHLCVLGGSTCHFIAVLNQIVSVG